MKNKVVSFGLIAVLLLSGCGKKEEVSYVSDKPMVDVEKAFNSTYEESVSYTGYVAADEMKKFSFELGGTIKEVAVEKGDSVTTGQVLAKLDTDNISLAIDNANKNIDMANNQISQIDVGIEQANIAIEADKLTLEKAYTGLDAEMLTLKKIEDTYNSNINKLQLQYDNVKKTYDDTETLYNQGVATRSNLDTAKLALDIAQEDLNNALESKTNDMDLQQKKIDSLNSDCKIQEESIKSKENDLAGAIVKRDAANIALNQAKISLEQNQKYLNDSVLKSTIDGYVMEIVMKAGEVTGAGTPVVVVKSGKQVVNIGVPVTEYDKLSVGMNAVIDSDGKTTNAQITNIALYPDETTRTYNVELTPTEENSLVMGGLVNVSIPINQKAGCFVPISSIVSVDGVDYVYYVGKTEDGTDNIVKRKEIEKGEIDGEYIIVDGIDVGTLVIKSGIKDISENQLVTIGDDFSGE